MHIAGFLLNSRNVIAIATVTQGGKTLTRLDLGDLAQCPDPLGEWGGGAVLKSNREDAFRAPETATSLAQVPDNIPGTAALLPTTVFQTSQFSSCHDELLAKRILEPVTKDALVEAPLSITLSPLSCQGPTWPSCSELTHKFQANPILIWQQTTREY